MTIYTEIEPGISSAFDGDARAASYDNIAAGYDLIVGNPIYNRLVWGCSCSEYREAAAAFIDRVPEGPILDFGCGSLVFTAPVYRGHEARLVLLDRSLQMLRRGSARMPQGRFVQADVFNPPPLPDLFAGGMGWGMLHLFGSRSSYLETLRNLVQPGAPVAISCLVLAGRRLGDFMLKTLNSRGEAAVPETAAAVQYSFAGIYRNVKAKQIGNMLFLSGERPDA